MITASLVIYHNSRQELDTLLACVLRSPIDRLYIVDNSRHDLYRTLEHRSKRFCYIHNANDGYGAAHNIAMREAIRLGAKYHIVINPDIYFEEGTIERLVKYMDSHKKVGWVMPKITYPNGEVQHLCKLLPSPYDLIIRRFIPKIFFGKSRERFNPKISDRELNMPYLSGCFMFLRVSALRKVGLFDERFFMYGEDLDLSRRMHTRYRTVCYPDAVVVHAHRAESYHSRKMLKIHIKNIAMYFNKWGWIFDPERRKINRKVKAEMAKILLLPLLIIGSVSAQNITNQQIDNYIKSAMAEGRELQTDTLNTSADRARLRKNPEDKNLKFVAKSGQNENKIFGRTLFSSDNLTFTPNQNIATPKNYTLGAGDEVIIDIWGANQTTIRKVISPEGAINIDGIGPIYLSGMTIADAERYLQRHLSTIYSGIGSKNGTSHLKLSLGEIRTIDVHIMGEVESPGSYSLSSLATAFYALHKAGGVGDLGSLRNIRVVRNGRQVAKIDIYRFIMDADASDNIRLQEGDMIIVPPYNLLVKVKGSVKRPLFYELAEGETLAALLDYAGGFADDAYRRQATVTRKNGLEYQIYTVDSSDFGNFKMADGDLVEVGTIEERFENRLVAKGALLREGEYQLNDQTNSVKKLIEKAEGITGDAFIRRAILWREREDMTLQTIQIDLEGILNDTSPDIALQRNDTLYIPSIHELQETGSIEVLGEVAHPGTLPYADNTTLEDAIIQAGGLLPSASTVRVDISRPIIDSRSQEQSEQLCEQFTFALKGDFAVDSINNFLLRPFDRIYIRKSPAYQEPKSVKIDGEVLYGGEYPLSKKSERLSDLVNRAGGVTRFAYIKGARLIRKMDRDEYERKQSVLSLAARNVKDSIDVQSLTLSDRFNIGIDLEQALGSPGSDADIVLREGDELLIPQYNNTVRISGCVMSPNTVGFTADKRVKFYIEQAGGFSQHARKKSCYIVYMNGQIRHGKLNRSNIVEPGCEIIVPTKQSHEQALQSILSVATTSASLATMIATIGNILK